MFRNELFEVEFDKVSDKSIEEFKAFIVEKFPDMIDKFDCRNKKILVQDRTQEYYFCDILHCNDDTSEFGSYVNMIPNNLKYYQVYKVDEDDDKELIPIFIIKLIQNGDVILNPEFDPLFL